MSRNWFVFRYFVLAVMGAQFCTHVRVQLFVKWLDRVQQLVNITFDSVWFIFAQPEGARVRKICRNYNMLIMLEVLVAGAKESDFRWHNSEAPDC